MFFFSADTKENTRFEAEAFNQYCEAHKYLQKVNHHKAIY